LQSAENRQLVFDKMKEMMSTDRTKHNILPLSKYGLLQITRQRVRPEMNIITDEKCPSCKGTGEVGATILFTDEIENALEDIVQKVKTRRFLLRVHPFVSAYLRKGLFSLSSKWNRRYKVRIKVEPIPSYKMLEYRFFDRDENEIDLT